MIKVACLLAIASLFSANLSPSGDPYKDSISKWRSQTEADLKAERGWLSVAGLFWLKEGETTLGTNPASGIVLPPGSAPFTVGTVTFKDGQASLRVADGVLAKVGEKPITQTDLRSDADGSQTRVQIESLTLTVIKRGAKTGIRLYDSNSPGRKKFSGLKWFAIDPKYRIKAKYTAYDSPKQIMITNVLGDTQPSPNPGYVQFKLEGRTVRLEAQGGGDGFFFNFKDLTNGISTYPAGRFLDTDKAADGFVILDFNKAYNPPCAFTNFATCPLPPKANYLPIPIPAGEKSHHPA